MLTSATSSKHGNDEVAYGLSFGCPAQMAYLRLTQNWLEVWTCTTRNKLMTDMQPLHPCQDCNGHIELVAYQESGGAGLLGVLTEMPCTGMSLAP